MTKEAQEAERRLRERAVPVGDADLRAQIACLEVAIVVKDAALRDGVAKFDPGPQESIHYSKAVHSRTCQALDGYACDCRVGQWLTTARAALSPDAGIGHHKEVQDFGPPLCGLCGLDWPCPDAGKGLPKAKGACNEHPDGCPEGSHRATLDALGGK